MKDEEETAYKFKINDLKDRLGQAQSALNSIRYTGKAMLKFSDSNEKHHFMGMMRNHVDLADKVLIEVEKGWRNY